MQDSKKMLPALLQSTGTIDEDKRKWEGAHCGALFSRAVARMINGGGSAA